ncbi:Protein of unknown function [Pyronema omphalodes CBS 100304]|uniref:Uncharacterized protein n=1 Tax=Pyronema omphalodes (strain CBS 100304) TaxID=1076935 RepID=U4KZD4_PYROM|nr:Protein of unknown function [Pyronema omphalodes CBS 100304]
MPRRCRGRCRMWRRTRMRTVEDLEKDLEENLKEDRKRRWDKVDMTACTDATMCLVSTTTAHHIGGLATI